MILTDFIMLLLVRFLVSASMMACNIGHRLSYLLFSSGKLLTGLFTILLFANACAQTVTTNLVKAAPNFREVDGKLYNTTQSQVFQNLFVEPDIISTNGLLAWKLAPIRKSSYVPVNSAQQIGAYAPPAGGAYITGYSRDYRIIIHNWPANADEIELKSMSKAESVARHIKRTDLDTDLLKLSGNQMCVRAIKIGMFDLDGKVIETWDVGVPHFVAVVKTNTAPTKP